MKSRWSWRSVWRSPALNSVLLLVILLIGFGVTHQLNGIGSYALVVAIAGVNYLIWGVLARRRGQRPATGAR